MVNNINDDKLAFYVICTFICFLQFNLSKVVLQPQISQLISLLFFFCIVLFLLAYKFISPHFKSAKKFSFVDILFFFYGLYLTIQTLFVSENYSQLIDYSLIIFGFFFLFILFCSSGTRIINFLIVVFILAGFIQSLHGFLQILEVLPSNHSQFKITGSFNNPGPFAGYLASVIPFAVTSVWILNPNTKQLESHSNCFDLLGWQYKKAINAKRIVCIILIVITFFILFVIFVAKSRAAWLAVLVSTLYLVSAIYMKDSERSRKQYFNIRSRKLIFKSKKLKYIYIILLVSFLSIISTGLYRMKKDSADGRLLVWSVTSKMILDKPLLGHGENGFEANYMEYQADFFKQFPDSRFAYVADNNMYAFNEFLRITSEYGFVGLAIVLLILYFLLRGKPRETLSRKEKMFYVAAKGGLISILIFSLFSYPLEILPIKLNLVLFIAIISTLQKPVFSYKSVKFRVNIWIRRLVGIILIGISISFLFYTFKIYKAQKEWELGYTSLQLGAYKHSLRYFDDAWPMLKNNGEFLIQYGKALSLSSEYEKAISQLEQAREYLPNSIVYLTLGDCYKNTGKFDLAEKSYIRAMEMVPNRLYPGYLLAKLYYENGIADKALEMANKVNMQKAKINSIAVSEIKEEMQQIIQNLENK